MMKEIVYDGNNADAVLAFLGITDLNNVRILPNNNFKFIMQTEKPPYEVFQVAPGQAVYKKDTGEVGVRNSGGPSL